MQSSSGQGEQNSFIEGKRRDTVHRVCDFSLAESLPGKKRVLLPPFGLALQGLGAILGS